MQGDVRGSQSEGVMTRQKGKGPKDRGQPARDRLPENETEWARPRTEEAVCTHG